MIGKEEIEVFVLAGGKSSRMGTDKGLINFNGTPMIQHVLRLFDKMDLQTSIISSNEEYLKFEKPVYKDLIPSKGPLGGLYTALKYSESPMVLLLACDMPSINEEGIKSVMDFAETGKITVAKDDEKISPLFGCYPNSLKMEVKKAILADDLKMQDFVLKQDHKLLDFNALGNTNALRNLNTVEDLKAAKNSENRQYQ